MKRFWFGLIVTLVLAVGTIRPLMASGYFPMHDDTQIARVIAMGRALRFGQFPVRWVSDLGYGYGYPIFNFYGPLPYYAGGLLYMVGVDPVVATKWMMVAGMMLAALTGYVAAYPFIGFFGGVLAGTLLAYAPYHAVQLYVRGAVGELWATAFLPLVLYGFIKLFDERDSWGVLVGGVGLAGVILSHTILGYVTGGLLALGFCILLILRSLGTVSRSTVVRLMQLGILGLGVSAFFWLPALAEMGYTNVKSQVGATARVTDHVVCLSQLWSMPWGFGGSAPGCVADGMSFMIGKLYLVLAAFSFGLVAINKKIVNRILPYLLSTGLLFAVALFFVLPVSTIFWANIPGASFVQYPWRLLAFCMVSLSLLGATIVLASRHTVFHILAAVLVVSATLGLYSKYFVPQRMYGVSRTVVENTNFLHFTESKISDEYLTPSLLAPKKLADIPTAPMRGETEFTLEREIEHDVYKKYFVTTTAAQRLTLNTMYFPGWHYLVNGQEQTPELARGLPRVLVNPGRSAVELVFTDTWARTVGNFVTVVSCIVLLYIYGKRTIQTNA